MKRILFLLLTTSLVACAASDEVDDTPGPSTPGLTFAGANGPDTERVIVAFKPGRSASGRAALRAQGGRELLEIRGVEAVAAHLPAAARNGLANHPDVEYIEEDAVRRVSAASGTAESKPYGISLVQADQLAPGAAQRTVCIIDSGYGMHHDDLQDTNVTASPDPGTGDPFYDDNGHGTHVAGTIAALGGNSKGVVGVVSNGSLRLHIVKVFTAAGWAYSSSLANAAQACADNGANVINMSLGGSVKNRTEERKFAELDSKGILNIAAAGNDGNNRHHYPASYASVLSVAAIDANKTIASFSQYNSGVDIAAPGVAVESTTPWLATANVSNGGVDYTAHNVEGAANGTATGALADGGLCDSTGSYGGKIVLCQRGTNTFAEKVLNAQNGGAAGVVIYNNVAGDLFATMGESTSTIPALGVSDTIGATLKTKVGSSTTVTSTHEFPASGYEAWDGTSMAAPHVAGVAALVWTHFPAKTNAEIRNALTSTAEDLGAAGRDDYYGSGLVRAKAAYDALAATGGGGGGTTNQAPVASFTFNCSELACSFNGSGSSDADGTIASYTWSFGATGATASHTFAAAGSYAVTLTVKDNAGASSSTTKTVTVTSSQQSTLSITNVASAKTSNAGGFKITWTTNVPADSLVTFTCCGTFSNATLVTSHSMAFNGAKGATYEYTVTSKDANGKTATAGPFVHQN